MRGVAGEKETAELHRLDDKAPHARDALLKDRSRVGTPGGGSVEPAHELVPDRLVGPALGILVGCALQIQARDFTGTHREKREAALMMRVYKLVRSRRGGGENAEPRKRVNVL